MANKIPNVRKLIVPNISHMTGIEDPERTIKEILDFLELT